MPKAIIIDDREWERDVRIEGGRIITLRLADDWSQITFFENGKQLGNTDDFVFDEPEFNNETYFLSRMYVPIVRQGLGRASLELFKDRTGGKITCRSNDGIRREDGSHLTGDAPKFVEKMRRYGIIEPSEYEDPEDY